MWDTASSCSASDRVRNEGLDTCSAHFRAVLSLRSQETCLFLLWVVAKNGGAGGGGVRVRAVWKEAHLEERSEWGDTQSCFDTRAEGGARHLQRTFAYCLLCANSL